MSESVIVVTALDPSVWAEALSECQGSVDVMQIPLDPTAHAIRQVLDRTQAAGRVVVCVHGARANPGQTHLVVALRERPVILTSLSGPYDLLSVPSMPTVLVAYDETPASIGALGQVLCGSGLATGRLPVEVPGLYPRGSGMVPER